MKKLISTLIVIFVVSVCTVELAATNNSTTNDDKTNGVSKTSSNDNVIADDTNSNSTSGSTKLLKDSSLYVLPLLNSTKIDYLQIMLNLLKTIKMKAKLVIIQIALVQILMRV